MSNVSFMYKTVRLIFAHQTVQAMAGVHTVEQKVKIGVALQ